MLLRLRIVAILLILCLCVVPVKAQLGTVPYTFVSGNTILSSEVNSNFSTAYANALNRTGGTLTGTLAASADVTIDGVDISDFLDPSGIVFSGTAGAVGAPSFSRTGDTNTGVYFPAADELAITLGGVQKWLVNASGVTAFGVNIINSSGKIPALTATYFTSVDASTLTGLNATQLTSGTVPLARLSGITTTEILDGTLADIDISASAAITWTKVSKTGSSLADLTTRSAGDLSSGTLPDARLSGTYSSALTFSSASNSFRGVYLSSDGSAGTTGTCNFTASTVTVKNGLIITCPP